MNCCRHLILILFIFYFNLPADAQDSYVYQDSSIVSLDAGKPNQLNNNSTPGSDEEEETTSFLPDTSLLSNKLSIDPDSIRSLKKAKGLSYAENLDSLLYAHQQQLKARGSEEDEVSWLQQFFMSPITKYFFWMLAIVFIVFILSKLFFADGFFQRSYTKTAVKILASESGNLSNTADYSKLIEQAVRQQNYRLAVRYHYLQTLQKLAAKGAITFASDKTNQEYLYELSDKKYKKEFASLTLNYDYAWYGEFVISDGAFRTIEQKFIQFNSGI